MVLLGSDCTKEMTAFALRYIPGGCPKQEEASTCTLWFCVSHIVQVDFSMADVLEIRRSGLSGMGNSESNYSIQDSTSTRFIIPNKLHSAKDISSPLGHWSDGLKYQNECHGPSPLKSNQTFISRQYEYITNKLKSVSASKGNGVSGDLLPSACSTFTSSCSFGSNREVCNGYGFETLESSPRLEEDQSSPRVFLMKDGSVRVDFSNSGLIVNDDSGPVQLLKFSPTADANCFLSGVKTSLEAHVEPANPISSKGSSLSSNGSLYDLPWGTSVELYDSDNAFSNTQGQSVSTNLGFFNESLPANLYRDPRISSTFPTINDLPLSIDIHSKHRSSFAFEERSSEGGCEEKYSSFTLPCRTTNPFLDGSGKKGSIRKRFKRISDWTGSLNRKKTKQQKFEEPHNGDFKDCFESGLLTTDTTSPSLASSLLGFSKSDPQSSATHAFSGTDGTLHLENNALRQNIYRNFMRELKSPIEADVENWCASSTEETGSIDHAILGSQEQLDLLFDQEQGIVRRAGWLFFKPLLTVNKDRKLEHVGRRRWKQFWVTLKGCTLLFYETYGNASSVPESPSYALLAEDGVVQAVPEHPKKENVFCLSNSYGDVYLFQACSQAELENWVTAVHSASASLLAKRCGKEDTPHLLRAQIRALLQKIDMDGKIKKMAELQLSVVHDSKNRKAIENQIQQWEQNLERFNMDLFRLRCYLASLQGGELPNPKSLLSTTSRPSKAALARLGIFSVSSFHGLICSRDEATMRKRSMSLFQQGRSKRGLFSSLKGLDTLTMRGHGKKPSQRISSLTNICSTPPSDGGQWSCSQETTCVYMPDFEAVRILLKHHPMVGDVLTEACKLKGLDPSLHCLKLRRCVGDKLEVSTPSADEILQSLSFDDLEVSQLDVYTHIHMSKPSPTGGFGFAFTGYVDDHQNSHITISEVLPDGLAFSRGLRSGDEIVVVNGCNVSSLDLALMQSLFDDQDLHLTLKHVPCVTDRLNWAPDDAPQDSDHNHRRDYSSQHNVRPCIYLTALIELCVCEHSPVELLCSLLTMCWLWPDSVEGKAVFLNSAILALLRLLQSKLARLLEDLASCFACQNLPEGPPFMVVHHAIAEGGQNQKEGLLSGQKNQVPGHGRLEDTLQDASMDAVCSLYHSFQEDSGGLTESQGERASPEPPMIRPYPRHMTITERLRKVIQELVDTEKSYVKDLNCLFELYLKPLQKETFLTQDEMESLFGSLPEMLDFQKVFLQTLEEKISSSPDFNTLQTPMQFKVKTPSVHWRVNLRSVCFDSDLNFLSTDNATSSVSIQKLLFSLGASFLYYAEHFKLYSGFCANHIKVQKVLERAKTDRSFKEFLDARNPTKQHSSTLESYLIKPVQRVLKYPLLLRELVSLTDDESEEHYHLTEALKEMEKVASHINEMQKIYEDYGAVFEQLVAEQSGAEKEVTEISMGQFLMHSSVLWLNPFPSLGRMKKDPELTVFVFKRAVILVYRESTKVRKKMVTSRPALGDQCKFRWLIPPSALQVRLGNPADTDCIWELIHTRSHSEGRPETVFQLCSRTPESKVTIIRTIRSVLRENLRRNMQQFERNCKMRLTPLRKTLPPSAKLASSRARRASNFALNSDLLDSDGTSLSSGTSSSASTPLDQQQCAFHEPSIISNEDLQEWPDFPCPIESQFSRLRLTEKASRTPAPRVQPESGAVDTPTRHASVKSEAKHKPDKVTNSLRHNQGVLLDMRQQRHSLENSVETSVDLNLLLEKDFSVQSLTSVVNEDFFYDNTMELKNAKTS
ncbi:hypothetical protein DNTS_009354 [Danionella cerebrum]|uniref:T-lymphoma invasion and metastasis-inducing protein 2 n=1 Tax=Danionella cerebrum TaxID=2873325 RepID=A0A553QQ50_9TELE|nr:hypothetical protein DNTS_009354 [Danionella translucida]TRY92113.1 hypothetical protein DNTS_009354 [Danionella translucida]